MKKKIHDQAHARVLHLKSVLYSDYDVAIVIATEMVAAVGIMWSKPQWRR